MDWRSWRTWLLLAAAIIAIFAIYTFASPNDVVEDNAPVPQVASIDDDPRRTVVPVADRPGGVTSGGIEGICMECLEPLSGSYRSGRNLFAFVEPPPPPPPPPPAPAPLPADRDKDGIPDSQDNCPDAANPDQTDIDRNGIGAACQGSIEQPPPPPPPTPPEFTYKYLGTFGRSSRPIAAFSAGDQIVNVRVGETFGGRFILRHIGIESVDIGFVGFPPDVVKRVPVGQ